MGRNGEYPCTGFKSVYKLYRCRSLVPRSLLNSLYKKRVYVNSRPENGGSIFVTVLVSIGGTVTFSTSPSDCRSFPEYVSVIPHFRSLMSLLQKWKSRTQRPKPVVPVSHPHSFLPYPVVGTLQVHGRTRGKRSESLTWSVSWSRPESLDDETEMVGTVPRS